MNRYYIDLSTVAGFIQRKINNEFDLPVCIAGREGVGKSTLGYWLCILVYCEFLISKNIAYTTEQIKPKIFETPKHGAIMIDEATTAMYKRDHGAKGIKKLIKIFSQARQRNLFYVFCSPRIGDLDVYFREHRIRLWFQVTKRGDADIYRIDSDKMIGDPWHLNDAKMRKKFYIGTVKFPEMPEDVEEEYKRLKDTAFQELNNDGEEKEDGNGFSELDLCLYILHNGAFDTGGKRLTKGLSYRKISEATKQASEKGEMITHTRALKANNRHKVWQEAQDKLINA